MAAVDLIEDVSIYGDSHLVPSSSTQRHLLSDCCSVIFTAVAGIVVFKILRFFSH